MKDTFRAYYTNSDDITSYMVRMIDINYNDNILEPSAGEGVFIDRILRDNNLVKIDALDLSEKAIKVLKNKYSLFDNIKIIKTDSLFDEHLDFCTAIGGYYDKVIGNPPYGAWQDYEKRDLLKRKYPGQYVKETYSLFLLRSVLSLKISGKLSFIIPDTFMFLNMHSKLREYLLRNTSIIEILIFPSKFFPGVNFGYSNLSIITLKKVKEEDAINNTIRIIKGFKNSSEFNNAYNKDYLEHFEILHLKQSDILKNDQYRFILTTNKSMFENKDFKKIGDVASIVTGFYTGNNLKFIKVLNNDIKGGKNYDVVDKTKIYDNTSLDGIKDAEDGYIPYIKSAPQLKYKELKDEWFVKWDSSTIKFYKNNKKSRFQNSEYYFKTGIGIPMVKSSVIRAFLMKNRVFDQAIVGIFPFDSSKLYYILALMNSNVINNILHLINPTANNSSNYVKLIPYIEPNDETMKIINKHVEFLLTTNDEILSNKTQFELNEIFNKIYSQYI